MPVIYRYQPVITPGPDGTVIRHADTEAGEITPLCELDGWIYISVPDGVALPPQPDGITPEQVTVTRDLRDRLVRAAAPLKGTKQAARRRVAAAAGDAQDQIADLEMRVAMAERLLYVMAPYLLDGQAIPTDVRDGFAASVQAYTDALAAGDLRARVDLEYQADVVPRMISRATEVTDAVADHVAEIEKLIPRPA